MTLKKEKIKSKLHRAQAGVPQGGVLAPVLYLIFTADLSMTDAVLIDTFADDIAALSSHDDPTQASNKLQRSLHNITWRIKANEAKSAQVTFKIRRETCPPVTLNSLQISQVNEAKYLGLYLYRRLTWKKTYI